MVQTFARLDGYVALNELLTGLRHNREFMSQVVAWERLPASPARFSALEQELHPALHTALQQRGMGQFYTHQAAAIQAALQGDHVIIATQTASGKTACYNVPVLQTLLSRPQARALYLFPTKALAQDQLAELRALTGAGRLPIPVNSYDGDTPTSQRSKIRREGGILISNPDMLHAGILPGHPTWRDLFRQLQFVVIDEIHTYRGVFGSHVANVIRRLRRLCHFYGSYPQFILCSATIANPQEHAQRLVELPFTLVDDRQNGSPRGEKQFILYNPPVINEELGLRQSMVMAARDAAATFLAQNIPTIIFARARQTVELLLSYVQDDVAHRGRDPQTISGYRGGYLPLERREIERGLRQGEIQGVIATNALELGIDIGQLSAAIITGYPGTIASVWQQAGRAGRREAQSAVIFIANNSPLDQYICQHPRYLFGRSPEYALTNPNNERILVKHLLCATYEIPFRRDESFGDYGPVQELLELLQAAGTVHQTRDQYHWLGEGPPAHAFSLRTSGDEPVIIQDMTGPTVIGELDLESAPSLVHEGAVYMHQARTYRVESLDWEGRLAHVVPVALDYYTRATVGSHIRALMPEQEEERGRVLHQFGEVRVVTQATGYRKIKRYSHETLGFGPIDLPPLELITTGYWLIFSDALTEELYDAGILLRPNDYGPNWLKQRQLVLERDNQQCRTCGATSQPGQPLHIHHIRPFREYGYIPGENEHYLLANVLENLITLCPRCHRQAEAGQQTRSALGGLAYLLGNLAPLYLMCDPGDIQVAAESRSPLTQAPTIVIYETVAAGVGFSERLFALSETLFAAALELIADCRCRDGCPACVGPPGDIGPDTKAITRQLLQKIGVRS